MKFILTSPFAPAGDQPSAIKQLIAGIKGGVHDQVLLGVTGSGKTFTLANVIEKLQKPALIISHNKTLAAQLYQEFQSFFPTNAVSYFVSYYDYYQPEAYIPQTDTYIDKETQINDEIDKLRLAATTNLLTRNDTIIVASVSCIYNIGSPEEYERWVLPLHPGLSIDRDTLFDRLLDLRYERADYGFTRSTFRVRGDVIDIFPAYQDTAVRLQIDGNTITKLIKLDPITGTAIEKIDLIAIYPAKHYIADPSSQKQVFATIRNDLQKQLVYLKSLGKEFEAHRLEQRVTYDLEMIETMGYVNGIENYSRYFDRRNPGDSPYTLLDFYQRTYGNDWILIIDESHMTIPQIRGMYAGDRSRKETLINYGFRLPAALDNRPMRFDEFLKVQPQTIYVSATPDEWELTRAQGAANSKFEIRNSKQVQTSGVVEQLVRPTGLIDPQIVIRPTEGQIDDLIVEIQKRVAIGQRVLVTTLTKKMAEDLTKFLLEKNTKVQYLHSDVETLARLDVLENLRLGQYDVIVGINLLREGLDLPEVSLVAILDADKQGFLRSSTALIQTMGRAARHINGMVIMYADSQTAAMKKAIGEVGRRRAVQLAYNKKHGITPAGVNKPIRQRVVEEVQDSKKLNIHRHVGSKEKDFDTSEEKLESLTPFDRDKLIKDLTTQMRFFARDLRFEDAARVRDKIQRLKEN